MRGWPYGDAPSIWSQVEQALTAKLVVCLELFQNRTFASAGSMSAIDPKRTSHTKGPNTLEPVSD